jgi:hypothetical protein
MALIYGMCAVNEIIIYSNIKNISGQYSVVKKMHVHVFIKTQLPATGFLIVIFPTKKKYYKSLD